MTDNTKTTKLIEGKVASVLNERELAINIGAEHGVTAGMKFKVLADQPTEILDPETGESLGSFDRDKVRVRAIDIQARFSVCKTYKTRYVGGGSNYSFLGANLFAEPRKIVETLKTEDSALPPPLSEEESYVKKGDRVVQILKDDD